MDIGGRKKKVVPIAEGSCVYGIWKWH